MSHIRIAVLIVFFLITPFQARALSEKGFEGLHIFSKVLDYIENDYVEKADEQALIRGALKGLVSTLDPHSAYLPPEAYRELRTETRGRFGGVGIEVGIKKGGLTVVAPIDGAPAYRAGIKAMDKILKIDGEPASEMDLVTAVLKMRGKPGSKVTLTIFREEIKNPFDVTLTREIIKIPSVESEVLEEKYGYVKLRSFQENSSNELKKALKRFEKTGAINGVILDMRNNPGGLLDQAVAVADLFLDSGIIVTTVTRGQEIDRHEAHAGTVLPVTPMIILTNGGTASASEIVAGALQDHRQAVVLGTSTFGKGSVQTVVELDDGSALKLTIALYYTPKGRSIQAKGIVPDIIVEEMPPAEAPKAKVREEDLPGHLAVPGTAVKPEAVTAVEDYQKKVALEYLKSWEIFRRGDEAMKQ